jgi:predicted GNAT family acetyltransferase
MLEIRDKGAPVLAALMTPPHGVVLSRGDKNALPVLISDLKEKNLPTPSVIGPTDMAEAFVTLWGKEKVESLVNLPFYVLTAVNMPHIPQGVLERATEKDVSWLADWAVDFAKEAGLMPHAQKRDEKRAAQRVQMGLYVWKVENKPVTTVSHAPMTASGEHIGSVHTQPFARGKGYAAAATALVCQKLLDGGKKFCALFAVADNPISNHIYKKIGFVERCRYREYRFSS